ERYRAMKLLEKLIQRCRNECHTEYVFVPISLYSALVGREGENINRLQRQANATIGLHKDHSNPYLCIARIIGTKSDVDHACKLLNAEIERLLDEHGTDRLIVSRYCMPALIGRQGVNIRQINRISGARCTID